MLTHFAHLFQKLSSSPGLGCVAIVIVGPLHFFFLHYVFYQCGVSSECIGLLLRILLPEPDHRRPLPGNEGQETTMFEEQPVS